MIFLGFIVFENKLKEATKPAISTLRNANIRQIMCTGNADAKMSRERTETNVNTTLGDNPLTAISVSRECGLVEHDAEIFMPRFLSGSSTDPESRITWESVMVEGQQLDNDSLQVKEAISLDIVPVCKLTHSHIFH